jgi:hypothetical protein
MAGSLTMFADKMALNYIFGLTTFPTVPPATYYLCLSTDAAGATAAKYGGTFTEVSNSNAYARVAYTNSIATTTWATATGTSGTSTTSTKPMGATATATFPTPTGSWGTVNGFFITDSATYGAGNVWYYCDLTTPQTISSGNTVSFANGAIVVTMT